MSQAGALSDSAVAAGAVNKLSGNTGSATPSAGNINVVGSGNITTSGSGSTLTITETQTQIATNYTNVTFGMSPYTVVATDYYISVDCSGGPVTLNFPNSTTQYRLFVVKDRLGFAMTNNISLTTPGAVVTFDGLTTYVVNDADEGFDILFNGSTYEVF